MNVTHASGQVTMAWSNFDRFWESEKLFVLRERTQQTIFVFPKRVFQDTGSTSWFSELCKKNVSDASSRSVPKMEQAPEGFNTDTNELTLGFELTFRDYLNQKIASSFTWLIIGVVGVPIVAGFALGVATPNPRAVHTPLEMVCIFVIPFLLFMVGFLLLLITTHAWLAHRSLLAPCTVTLSDKGLMTTGTHIRAAQTWEQPISFKETKRSFIVWWPGTQGWLMLPKRHFPSPQSIDYCRALLEKHAKCARWWG